MLCDNLPSSYNQVMLYTFLLVSNNKKMIYEFLSNLYNQVIICGILPGDDMQLTINTAKAKYIEN